LPVADPSCTNVVMPRRANRARGILLKGVGTAVLLVSFVAQSVFVEDWSGRAIAMREQFNTSSELEHTWEIALHTWHQSTGDPEADFEVRKAGGALVIHDHFLCSSYREECGFDDSFDYQAGRALVEGRATTIEIEQRVAKHLADFKPRKQHVYDRASELDRAAKRSQTAEFLAYLFGTIVLIVGLLYEWKGVDE
jgi:hypothetical protein